MVRNDLFVFSVLPPRLQREGYQGKSVLSLLIVIPCLTFKLFALPVCQRGARTTSEFEMHSFPFPLVTVIDDNMQEVKPRSLGNIVVR